MATLNPTASIQITQKIDLYYHADKIQEYLNKTGFGSINQIELYFSKNQGLNYWLLTSNDVVKTNTLYKDKASFEEATKIICKFEDADRIRQINGKLCYYYKHAQGVKIFVLWIK